MKDYIKLKRKQKSELKIFIYRKTIKIPRVLVITHYYILEKSNAKKKS